MPKMPSQKIGTGRNPYRTRVGKHKITSIPLSMAASPAAPATVAQLTAERVNLLAGAFNAWRALAPLA